MTNLLNSIYNNIKKTNEISNKFKLKINGLKNTLGGNRNLKTKRLKNNNFKTKNLKMNRFLGNSMKNKYNTKTIKNRKYKPLERANNILKNYYRQKYSF